MSIGFRIRAMQLRKLHFGLASLPPPPARVVWIFSNTRSFRAAFPITVAKPSIYPSIGQNFRQREKKGRGVFGFGLLPLAARLSRVYYNPCPVARPICRFSNAAQKRVLFPFREFSGENRWIARVLVARVVDGEGIESRITEYPKNKKKRGTIDVARSTCLSTSRDRRWMDGCAAGGVYVCTPCINIYYVSRVRYLNTRGKSDSESRPYSPRFYIPDALEFTNIEYERKAGERNLLKNRAVPGEKCSCAE